MPTKKETHKDLPVIPFATYAKWLKWLAANHKNEEGVWIKFAKKNSGIKTISYVEAREGAIMYGWIDGQKYGWDEDYYLIRLTPRRPRSVWSKVNREIAIELIKSKKMKPTGQAQVDAAKADGRWQAAYDSSSTMKVPADLKKLLKANPNAKKFFATISKANEYSFLYRIQTSKKPETRQRHLNKTIEMLNAGKVYHPDLEKKSNKKSKTQVAKKKVAKKKAVKKVGKKTAKKKTTKKKRPTSKATKTKTSPIKKAAKSNRCIALLRGINVSGKNIIKMADLRTALTEAGFDNVETYIQSGNVLFDSNRSHSELEVELKKLIKKKFRCEVPVLVRDVKFFKKLIAKCPYKECDKTKVAATILSAKATKAQLKPLAEMNLGNDEYHLAGDIIYLHCPSGFGRTKLTNNLFESKLKLDATTRNWRTINKLVKLGE